MAQIDNLRTKIDTEYLSSDAQADGYTVYPVDDNDAPNTSDTAPDDYIIIADGKPYLVQTDTQPVIIAVLSAEAVAEHLDNGNELSRWMRSLT
jgi:hypothetical protein